VIYIPIEKIQLDRVCEELESSDEVEISDYLGHGITTFIRQWSATIPVTIKLVDFENPDKIHFTM